MKEFFKAAIQNIYTHGDTDIFPYPIDNHIFHDTEQVMVDLMMRIHKEFWQLQSSNPPEFENSLSAIGYTGYRWATMIDPIWNAYLLGLVISLCDEIEAARIPTSKDVIFSYRYKLDKDKKSIFDLDIGWNKFQEKSTEHAQNHEIVLICDIADFYSRIYHHELQNALQNATKNKDKTIKRIISILDNITRGRSYGLPIGGPSSRILSELVLNRVDRMLLNAEGITFCRFADDYHIFANSEERAYEILILLSGVLYNHRGLSIQKSKTRIMSSNEFLALSEFAELKEAPDPGEVQARNFLTMKLKFDPYSPTAKEDYEKLKNEIRNFDIMGMLTREIGKGRVHRALTKRLIKAIEFLKPSSQYDAMITLVEDNNLNLLYPVFPNIMLLLKRMIKDVEDDEKREMIFNKIRKLIMNKSYILMVPVNLGFAIRILADDKSEEAELLLAQTYKSTQSAIIKRDIILIMAKRNAIYWISDRKQDFTNLHPWEQRSFLIAMSILGEDEREHFQKYLEKKLSFIDKHYLNWINTKRNVKNWSIPI